MTPKNSSRSSASAVKPDWGSDTTGLKQIENNPLISPAWMASMISWAVRPRPGMSAGSQPHTDAMYSRCSGFSMSRLPGSCSAFWPCSRPALPVALAGDHADALSGPADTSGREAQG